MINHINNKHSNLIELMGKRWRLWFGFLYQRVVCRIVEYAGIQENTKVTEQQCNGLT